MSVLEAAGRARVGAGKRRKTGTAERSREEGRMAGKVSMGARMEVAKPGKEMELLWVLLGSRKGLHAG